MASQVGEDDDMDFGEWTPVSSGGRSGRGRSRKEEAWLLGAQSSKRSPEECSSDEGSRVVRRKTVTEEFKVILKDRKMRMCD